VVTIDARPETSSLIGAWLSRSNHEASLLVIETLFGWISSAGAVCAALARQAELV
jgi:hypothetical protein